MEYLKHVAATARYELGNVVVKSFFTGIYGRTLPAGEPAIVDISFDQSSIPERRQSSCH